MKVKPRFEDGTVLTADQLNDLADWALQSDGLRTAALGLWGLVRPAWVGADAKTNILQLSPSKDRVLISNFWFLDRQGRFIHSEKDADLPLDNRRPFLCANPESTLGLNPWFGVRFSFDISASPGAVAFLDEGELTWTIPALTLNAAEQMESAVRQVRCGDGRSPGDPSVALVNRLPGGCSVTMVWSALQRLLFYVGGTAGQPQDALPSVREVIELCRLLSKQMKTDEASAVPVSSFSQEMWEAKGEFTQPIQQIRIGNLPAKGGAVLPCSVRWKDEEWHDINPNIVGLAKDGRMAIHEPDQKQTQFALRIPKTTLPNKPAVSVICGRRERE